jgi:hypothetical protein
VIDLHKVVLAQVELLTAIKRPLEEYDIILLNLCKYARYRLYEKKSTIWRFEMTVEQ